MTRDIFPALVSNIASNVALFTINKFQRRIKGKGAVRGGKGSTVIYCNKSLEDLGVLIDGVAESVKHEIKKKNKVDFLVVYCHLWLLHWYNLRFLQW